MGGEKSTGGGRKFLSKVVRFVTNPTTQWSQLDHPADLKGLIERKKRDDLVRGREISTLRKLLGRSARAGDTPQGPAADARASTGIPDTGAMARDTGTARARTLRQIEELDAQMTGGGPLARVRTPPTLTQVAGPEEVGGDGPSGSPPPPPAPASDPGRAESLNTPMGPEVEEIAIHFANGNFGDAESGLLRLVDSPGTHREDDQVWLMLFDLYRATGQANKFSDLGVEFANQFDRSAPQWLRRLDVDGDAASHAAALGESAADPSHIDWRAPPWLDEPALAYVQASFTPDTTQWSVDWRGVETMDPAALPVLVDILQRWADKTMMLTWLGSDRLEELLATHTAMHERGSDPNWWLARLAVLRLLDRMDDFEEAALAYCMTYEVSPPAWTEPRARVVLPEAEAAADAHHTVHAEPTTFPPTAIIPERHAQVDSSGVFRLQLEGELLGDVSKHVGALPLTSAVNTIECDCHNLRRVDFGAAGALFNWVMDQQGQGRYVMFVDVNRLVAAFFGIIGIADVTAVIRAED